MAAPTPSEIAEASPCFDCIDNKLAALLYLLNQNRLAGGGSAMTPNEISEAAVCFDCIDNKWAAVLYLLANGGGGGGGGSGGISSGVVDPVAAPSDPSVTNWYVNTAAGTGWVWPAGGAAWQQIV